MAYPISSSHKAPLNKYQIKNISITCQSMHKGIKVVKKSARCFKKKSFKDIAFLKKNGIFLIENSKVIALTSQNKKKNKN